MLEKLNKLDNWQAALIILFFGIVVFFNGLHNPFMRDDLGQIVNNTPVHSLSNFTFFFEGGTFYSGQGTDEPLTGFYYRPLMTVAFSALYTVFGPNTFYFHLFQLFVCIAGTIMFYLFLRYSFKPALALLLALVFLVHPINSQTVYFIPYLQDGLFFLFGIAALWSLVRFNSKKSLIIPAFLLFLALLAKETAIIFVALSLLYLFWYNRRRFVPFFGMVLIPVGVWLYLRIQAVGFAVATADNAPIGRLDLFERLMTMPSIFLFYFTKLVFPFKLASSYYWTHPTFSFQHVLLPLIIDVAIIALAFFVGYKLYKTASKSQYYTYLFFVVWTALGIGVHMQLKPLDGTACESWFYLPMAGLLGMIGVTVSTFLRIRKLNKQLVLALGVIIITVFCVLTFLRSFDWRSELSLSTKDIANSKEHYVAYNNLVKATVDDGQYEKAEQYLRKSIAIFPNYSNYGNLGNLLAIEGRYAEADKAYSKGISYSPQSSPLYERRAALTLVHGTPAANKQYLIDSLNKFPTNSYLWMQLAVINQRYFDKMEARYALNRAEAHGTVPEFVHTGITLDLAFSMGVPELNISTIVD